MGKDEDAGGLEIALQENAVKQQVGDDVASAMMGGCFFGALAIGFGLSGIYLLKQGYTAVNLIGAVGLLFGSGGSAALAYTGWDDGTRRIVNYAQEPKYLPKNHSDLP